MINLHERMLPTSAGVEPATSWSPVGRRIQLSHRGRRKYKFYIFTSENITFSKYAFYFINNSLYFITLYIINVRSSLHTQRFITWIFCGKLHEWFLIKLWLIALLPSLIVRRLVGSQTKLGFSPQCVSDGRCLTIDICVRAHRGLVLWFSCVLASDRKGALCFISSHFFYYMSFTVMFHK